MADSDEAPESANSVNNHCSTSVDKPDTDNHSVVNGNHQVHNDVTSDEQITNSRLSGTQESEMDVGHSAESSSKSSDMDAETDMSKLKDLKSDEDEFHDAHEGAGVRLRKDDSGIEITEKSPSKDSSVQSETDGRDESGMDLSESRQEPAMDLSESRHESAQSEHDSESEPATQNSDDPGQDEMRPRRRRRLSSSESDADEVSTVKLSSDSEEEMDNEPLVGEPKQHQIYKDILRRECGYRSKISPLNFTETITSNLSLVQRLELQYKLDQHTGCVNALHYSQNGNLLASGSDDLKVVVWDWSRQKPAIMFDSGHRNNVFQAKFMPFSGDCHVVTCARDGQVRLAELSTTGVCKSTKKLAQHKGAAHKLSLEMDSPHVFLSCGEDAATFQIDLREQKPHKLLITKENEARVPIYSIHTNPCNSYEFCLAGRDRFLRLYDKRKIAHEDEEPTLKKFCPSHMSGAEDNKCNVTCAVFSYNGTEILGSYNDEDIYLFDTSHSDGADFVKKYHGHRNNATVKGVNFYGPKSEYVISGSDCGNIYIWDKESEKVVQFFRGDEGGVVNVLEPHPYGPYLATSGLDSDVKIWAPTAEEAEDLSELPSTMKKNRKERRNDRLNEPDMLDGQAIWLLMQHLRRTVRRREANGDDGSDEESLSASDSDSDAGVDQCNPS